MSLAAKLPIRKWITSFQSGIAKSRRYASFDEAAAECEGMGYDCADLAQSVVAKTSRYRERIRQQKSALKLDLTSSFSLASMALAAQEKTGLRVLDFGGAAGMHYFLARQLLPHSTRIQWVVVETPTMVEFARSEMSTGELFFVTSIAEANKSLGQVDLVYCSGAIQYVADPCRLVGEFAALQARFLLLNRTGVTAKDQDFIATHQSKLKDHGPGDFPVDLADRIVRTPFVFVSEQKLLQALSGYHLIARIDDSSGVFPVQGEPIKGIGLLASRDRQAKGM